MVDFNLLFVSLLFVSYRFISQLVTIIFTISMVYLNSHFNLKCKIFLVYRSCFSSYQKVTNACLQRKNMKAIKALFKS